MTDTQPTTNPMPWFIPYLAVAMLALTAAMGVAFWVNRAPQPDPYFQSVASVKIVAEREANVPLYTSFIAKNVSASTSGPAITITATNSNPDKALEQIQLATVMLQQKVIEVQNLESNKRLAVWREQQRVTDRLGFDPQPPTFADLNPVNFGSIYVLEQPSVKTSVVEPEPRQTLQWAVLAGFCVMFIGGFAVYGWQTRGAGL